MKPTAALALLAVLGFTVAGCGATKKIALHAETTPATLAFGKTITVAGATTTTSANVKSGTRIACKDWDAQLATVPPRGEADGGRWSSGGSELQMTHLKNGSLIASCKP
jgi:hypothetical protein